ncbi:hypothetical protein APHAL10511_004953 [Amanita phalloides]|nr:hypothetical protein APHAL10511_004953 [Amanita phalloides]
MANKATPDKTIQGTLQRGKACLRCRKRKMRCDGIKPACQQCIRSKKGDVCEYDDGKGKTRTQLLREHIARLEQRIRELEDPDYVSPAVTLYDPHMHSRSGSSSSSFGSPGSVYLSASRSPFPSESPTSPETSWNGLQNVPSPSRSPLAPEVVFFDHRIDSQPPIELAQMLLDIFAPHRHQCGLDVHFGRLRESQTRPLVEQRHPVLMNAIFLWACFVSRPEPLCSHEEHYLQLALKEIPDALQRAENTIDIIQASCLLSLYFLANGRFIEGGYHASAAASLTIQNGLGDRETHVAHIYSYGETGETFDLKPHRSDIKAGERILTFWQVYNLDRCWSVVLRRPAIIPDNIYSITCPWPQSISEYETGHIDAASSTPTIRAFLRGEVDPSSFSIQALRAKASTLFACSSDIAMNWESSTKTADILHDVQALEHSIAHFLSTLINLEQLDAISIEDKFSLLATHTLAHTAMIQLYRSFSSDDAVSFEKCARAARSCILIVKQLSDQDFTFLDPIVGPCWSIVGEFLIQEMDSIESTWPFVNTSDVRNDLSTVFYALTCVGPRFPLVAPYIAQFRKRLAQPSLS